VPESFICRAYAVEVVPIKAKNACGVVEVWLHSF
jgi:hypothetical protein